LGGFLDADWVREVDGRKSMLGYAFNLGNGIISWVSKKQNFVALSLIDV
jgi:hypothetical protein